MADELSKKLEETKKQGQELYDSVIMFKNLVRFLVKTTGNDHDTCVNTAIGRIERAESKNKQKKS